MASGCMAGILPFTDSERRVYEEHREELDFRGEAVGTDAYELLKQGHRVSDTHGAYLKQLLIERETRKATYDYMGYGARKRLGCKQRIDSLYLDSISIRLFEYDPAVAGEAVMYACRLAKAVGMDADTKARVERLGLAVARELDRNPTYRYEVRVMDTLRACLTREQLARVLRVKNSARGTAMAREAWRVATERGLVEAADSADLTSKADIYYTEELVVRDMFVGHGDALGKNLNWLRKQQPALVRMAGAVSRKLELGKKGESNGNDNGMAW